MGIVVSRPKQSLREILFTLDEKIEKTRATLEKHRLQLSTFNLYSGIIFISTIIISPIFLFNSPKQTPLVLFLIAVFYGFMRLFSSFLVKRINNNENLLKNLKESQKKRIEELKKDSMFMETMSIVEKYSDEGRDYNKDKQYEDSNVVDTLTNIVLGSDPSTKYALICSNCGAHNGLVHPRDYSITRFECFKCEKMNERGGVQKNK